MLSAPEAAPARLMVPVAQWQSTGLWIQLLRVQPPSGTPLQRKPVRFSHFKTRKTYGLLFAPWWHVAGLTGRANPAPRARCGAARSAHGAGARQCSQKRTSAKFRLCWHCSAHARERLDLGALGDRRGEKADALFKWADAPAAVVDFLTARTDAGARPATINVKVAAIAAAHRTAKQPDPTRSEDVRLVLAGIRRKKGTRPQKKAPIGRDELRGHIQDAGLGGKRARRHSMRHLKATKLALRTGAPSVARRFNSLRFSPRIV
jgi:hypothetical protein